MGPEPPAAAGEPQPPPLLPIAGMPAREERSDAARNRARILAAAARLFEERGVANVSMDEIAEAASVGKGTLYRRFGDRSGLAFALLDEREAEFQEAFVRGPAPLGPGAPPAARLRAFLAACTELLESHHDLILDAETSVPGARHRTSIYASYHAHVAMLLRELDATLDSQVVAHTLLGPVAADLYGHMRHGEGMGRERVLAALTQVVDALERAADDKR